MIDDHGNIDRGDAIEWTDDFEFNVYDPALERLRALEILAKQRAEEMVEQRLQAAKQAAQIEMDKRLAEQAKREQEQLQQLLKKYPSATDPVI